MRIILAALAWTLSAGLNCASLMELKALQDEVRALHTFLQASLEEGQANE